MSATADRGLAIRQTPLAVATGLRNNARMHKRLALLMLVVVALAGCASEGKRAKVLDAALYAYAGAIRWGEFDRAWQMVDPDVRKEHPLSDVEWSRFAQIQITHYRVQSSGPTPDQGLEQFVELGVLNRHTQAERVVLVHELWRWDEPAKRWWLMSGFPELSGGN